MHRSRSAPSRGRSVSPISDSSRAQLNTPVETSHASPLRVRLRLCRSPLEQQHFSVQRPRDDTARPTSSREAPAVHAHMSTPMLLPLPRHCPAVPPPHMPARRPLLPLHAVGAYLARCWTCRHADEAIICWCTSKGTPLRPQTCRGFPRGCCARTGMRSASTTTCSSTRHAPLTLLRIASCSTCRRLCHSLFPSPPLTPLHRAGRRAIPMPTHLRSAPLVIAPRHSHPLRG